VQRPNSPGSHKTTLHEKHTTTHKGRLGGWEVCRSKNNSEDPCVNVRGNARALHHALCVVAARLTSPSWVGSGCRSGGVCVRAQTSQNCPVTAHQSSKTMKLRSVLYCHLVEMVGHSDCASAHFCHGQGLNSCDGHPPSRRGLEQESASCSSFVSHVVSVDVVLLARGTPLTGMRACECRRSRGQRPGGSVSVLVFIFLSAFVTSAASPLQP
jgi:hypothetical protein